VPTFPSDKSTISEKAEKTEKTNKSTAPWSQSITEKKSKELKEFFLRARYPTQKMQEKIAIASSIQQDPIKSNAEKTPTSLRT